ncbi:MAG: zinc ribbon domain-containing protein [Treponema sp.]|jgi:DNA-directed RNA polymerase subunit RPC12/RpoP|nr:zinc ribbon domain-containing protein [Treponema sp.]
MSKERILLIDGAIDISGPLQAEYPEIGKLLADFYVKLKNKMNGVIPLSKQCRQLKKSYLANPIYFKCENCAEHFHIEDIIIENDKDHCPYCGSTLKKAQPHKDRGEK